MHDGSCETSSLYMQKLFDTNSDEVCKISLMLNFKCI